MNEPNEARISDLVDESFLFKGLDADVRAILKAQAVPRHFAVGVPLIREDEEGLELFIIESGDVKVSMIGSGDDVKLAKLGPGAVIGEVAVLTEAPRTSTVIASTEVVAIAFMAETIRDITESNPKLKDLMFRLIEGRARHTISMIPEE